VIPDDSSLRLCILSSLCQYRAFAFNCRIRTKKRNERFPMLTKRGRVHYLAIVQRSAVCEGYGVVCGIVDSI